MKIENIFHAPVDLSIVHCCDPVLLFEIIVEIGVRKRISFSVEDNWLKIHSNNGFSEFFGMPHCGVESAVTENTHTHQKNL